MTRETNSVLRKKFNDIIKIKPNIQNVVCTVDLNTVLDLKKIALKAKNTEFNPKKFHALVIRSREPKATALIFKSGKMVCTGTKTENEAKEATLKFLKVIKQAGFSSAKIKVSIQKKNFEVRNVVATCDFKKSIKLETVMFAYRNQCMYEPEIFPGLIFRPEKSKIVAIMFLTGKVVITGYINGIGAKSFDDMWRVYNFLIKIFLDLNLIFHMKNFGNNIIFNKFSHKVRHFYLKCFPLLYITFNKRLFLYILISLKLCNYNNISFYFYSIASFMDDYFLSTLISYNLSLHHVLKGFTKVFFLTIDSFINSKLLYATLESSIFAIVFEKFSLFHAYFVSCNQTFLFSFLNTIDLFSKNINFSYLLQTRYSFTLINFNNTYFFPPDSHHNTSLKIFLNIRSNINAILSLYHESQAYCFNFQLFTLFFSYMKHSKLKLKSNKLLVMRLFHQICSNYTSIKSLLALNTNILLLKYYCEFHKITYLKILENINYHIIFQAVKIFSLFRLCKITILSLFV